MWYMHVCALLCTLDFLCRQLEDVSMCMASLPVSLLIEIMPYTTSQIHNCENCKPLCKASFQFHHIYEITRNFYILAVLAGMNLVLKGIFTYSSACVHQN